MNFTGQEKKNMRQWRKNEQQQANELQMKPCVDCAESFAEFFLFLLSCVLRMRTFSPVETKEVIPINFIAPVRLFSTLMYLKHRAVKKKQMFVRSAQNIIVHLFF